MSDERRMAAMHIRARDLRKGDVIVREGRILEEPHRLDDRKIFVSLARQSYNHLTLHPDEIVLVEVACARGDDEGDRCGCNELLGGHRDECPKWGDPPAARFPQGEDNK